MSSNNTRIRSDKLKHAEEINRTLFAIANAVNTASDLTTLYKEIHQSLNAIIDVSNFYIALVDNKTKMIRFPYHIDHEDSNFFPMTEYDSSNSLTGMLISYQKPLLLKGTDLIKKSNENGIMGPVPKIWMGVPLKIEGVVIGVIAVQSYIDSECFTQNDLMIMSTVSDQIALAISRKQAEEKLNKSEKRYRNLFEKSKDAILIIKNQKFVDCNQATVDMLGYENKHQLLQTHPSKLSPPNQPDGKESFLKANEMMDIAVENGSNRFEWDHLRANGTVFPVEVLLTAISTENDNQEIHTIWRDITERKHAEKLLKLSQDRFITVLDSIDATVYVADIETNEILFMNKYMKEIFGRDMTGEFCNDVFRMESEPYHYCPIDKLVDKNGNPTGVHAWQSKNPITEKWYMNYDRAIEWTDNRIVKIQIATDITHMKKLEEELRQAHKMESIGTLAGGIAHDFNNILGIILGNTELALDDMPKGSPARECIQEIKTASLRAKDVVRQLLSFSRKTNEELIAIDLVPVVNESLNLIRSSIPSSIEIRSKIPETCKTILGNATQIHQIMINLCTNAAHEMNDTGGILEVKLTHFSNKQKTDSVIKKLDIGDYVKLVVKDTGSGFDTHIREKIFDPYFTTKDVGKGTGMGLAVVQGIVKNHSGEIYVDSKPGEGTSFTILFPTIDAKPEKELNGVSLMKYPLGKESILFVDDEESLVKMARIILMKLGYKILAVTSPLEALIKFEEKPDYFDLVISDMTMPQMNGVKLSEKIKKIRPHIPIIICSGHSSLIEEEKSKGLSVSAYAMKPITILDIAMLIRKVLDK